MLSSKAPLIEYNDPEIVNGKLILPFRSRLAAIGIQFKRGCNYLCYVCRIKTKNWSPLPKAKENLS